MYDYAIIYIAISLWVAVPQVHLHTATTPVRGGGKIGIVGNDAILGICNYIIVSITNAALVVSLEMSSSLLKTILVHQVVNDIHTVK